MALNVNVPDDAAGADVALIPSVPSRVLPPQCGVHVCRAYLHRFYTLDFDDLGFAQADPPGRSALSLLRFTIVLIIR